MSIRAFFVGMFFAGALVTSCKSSTVADLKDSAGDEACSKSCGDAQSECVEQCKTDVNKDVCEVTCKEANDKCESECKEKTR